MAQMVPETCPVVKSVIKIIIIYNTVFQRVSWTRACDATSKAKEINLTRNKMVRTWIFLAISATGGVSILPIIQDYWADSDLVTSNMEISIRIWHAMEEEIMHRRRRSMTAQKLSTKAEPLAKEAKATPCTLLT